MLTVKTSELNMLMLKGMQELSEQVEGLKTELAALRAQG